MLLVHTIVVMLQLWCWFRDDTSYEVTREEAACEVGVTGEADQ